jgi:hypothetical protein
MANIDRIVKVSISLQTAGITSVSFSDLLLYGSFTSPNLVEIITDADQLLDLGVVVTDPLYLAAQVAFSEIPHINQVYIGKNTNTTDPTNDLIAIANENNDWYGIIDVTHDPTKIVEIAAWVEANEKLQFTVLDDWSASSPAAALQTGNYFRTAWWSVADAATDFVDVAIASKSFTKYPGQETWANAQLQAVPYLNMTETAAQAVFTLNGNTFEPFRNISITQNGKVTGGEWIDIIRFRDWLCETIKVNIFQQMVDNRIPYTDPGIAIIRSRLIQSLDQGVVRGGIAPPEVDAVSRKVIPSYIVTVPLASTISPNQKATRVLQDIYFTARLAGAIHVVEIQGTLTYENLAVGSATVASFTAGRSGQAAAMGV